MPKPDQSVYPQERIPPGQFVTEKFPVLHQGNVPYFEPKTWDLQVYGAVEKPLKLSYADVRGLPTKQVTVDIHCVTTWSKLDTTWEGVPTAHLMDLAGVKPEAKYAIFECDADYTANVLVEDLRKPNTLLAFKYGGKDLTPEHGFPLRALVPHRYFWKSAKWVRAVRFEEEDELGYWERNGYHNNADYWDEERYAFEGDQSLRPLPTQGTAENPGPAQP